MSLVLLAQVANKNNNNQVVCEYMHTRLNILAVLKFLKKEYSLLTNLTLLIGKFRNKENQNGTNILFY